MTAQQNINQVTNRQASVMGFTIHYQEAGIQGDTVTLLIHGWPTSSYLWRNITPQLSESQWVVALDLPGFGRSDKPTHAAFDYDFWDSFIEEFIKVINAKKVNLVVHDLGGPVGLSWAVRHSGKVNKLILLNTIVYSKLNWSAKLFLWLTRLPLARSWITQPKTIAQIMQLGMQSKLSAADRAMYAEPFYDKDAQKTLLLSVRNLDPKTGKKIDHAFKNFKMPVACIYGEKDRLLLDAADTMAKVKMDLPQAQVTSLPNCGHFLQEDNPQELTRLMANFLSES